MKNLNPKQWKKALEEVNGQIIDVRTPEEFQEAHIPNAKLINVQEPQQFITQINKLDKTAHYFVYCGSGNRSNQACLVFEHNDFKNLYNLEGGFEAWNAKS